MEHIITSHIRSLISRRSQVLLWFYTMFTFTSLSFAALHHLKSHMCKTSNLILSKSSINDFSIFERVCLQ